MLFSNNPRLFKKRPNLITQQGWNIDVQRERKGLTLFMRPNPHLAQTCPRQAALSGMTL